MIHDAEATYNPKKSNPNQWKIAAEQLALKSVWQYACEHIITAVTCFRLQSSLLLSVQNSG
jgi:hypothetical protein